MRLKKSPAPVIGGAKGSLSLDGGWNPGPGYPMTLQTQSKDFTQFGGVWFMLTKLRRHIRMTMLSFCKKIFPAKNSNLKKTFPGQNLNYKYDC